MEPRKIIKFGTSSYVITLPLEWLEQNGLSKGDTINLYQKQDSILLSVPKEQNLKEGVIELDNKPLKLFNKELLSYYLKNYKTIVIKGKDLIPKLDQIRVFKEKVSSLEIVEITKEKIVLRDLSNPAELNINSLIKEIIEMEKMLFEELFDDDKDTKYQLITQLDKNINKLTFLGNKAINYNLGAWENPDELKDAIHLWRIISSLETIGDITKRIARYLKNETDDHNRYIEDTLRDLSDYFTFITSLLQSKTNIDVNLRLYLDKKQSLLKDFEMLRNKLHDDLNLFLVITQLFKDVVGQLDTVVLSIIDLKLK